MRTSFILIGAATLIVAGCGDQARDEATSESPASYDALSSDRTRGRDDVPTTSAGGGDVQNAYDQQRSDQRSSGALGTDGETARTGLPSDGAVGGSSAGSESTAPARIPARPESASPGDDPIPYGGSRRIDAPYPGLSTDGGDRRQPASTGPVPEAAPREEPRYQGIPPAENGPGAPRSGY